MELSLDPQSIMTLLAATLLAIWQAAAYAAVASAVGSFTRASSTFTIVALLLLLGLSAPASALPLPDALSTHVLPATAIALAAGIAIALMALLRPRWRLAILEPSVSREQRCATPWIGAGLLAFAITSMAIAAALRGALEFAPAAWSPVICALALPPGAAIGCAAAAGGVELLVQVTTAPLPATMAGLVVAAALAGLLSRWRDGYA